MYDEFIVLISKHL